MDAEEQVTEILIEFLGNVINIPTDLPYDKYKVAKAIVIKDTSDKILEVFS